MTKNSQPGNARYWEKKLAQAQARLAELEREREELVKAGPLTPGQMAELQDTRLPPFPFDCSVEAGRRGFWRSLVDPLLPRGLVEESLAGCDQLLVSLEPEPHWPPEMAAAFFPQDRKLVQERRGVMVDALAHRVAADRVNEGIQAIDQYFPHMKALVDEFSAVWEELKTLGFAVVFDHEVIAWPPGADVVVDGVGIVEAEPLRIQLQVRLRAAYAAMVRFEEETAAQIADWFGVDGMGYPLARADEAGTLDAATGEDTAEESAAGDIASVAWTITECARQGHDLTGVLVARHEAIPPSPLRPRHLMEPVEPGQPVISPSVRAMIKPLAEPPLPLGVKELVEVLAGQAAKVRDIHPEFFVETP